MMLLQLRLSPGDQSLSNLWLQFVTLSRYLPSYNQFATSCHLGEVRVQGSNQTSAAAESLCTGAMLASPSFCDLSSFSGCPASYYTAAFFRPLISEPGG